MTTEDKSAKRTFGIVLYDIQLNGNLNGVFTNIPADGNIFTETAILKMPLPPDNYCGIYDCFYFDRQSMNQPIQRNDVELKISCSRHRGTYSFLWTNLNGNAIFEGTGFLMNERQFAVNYFPV